MQQASYLLEELVADFKKRWSQKYLLSLRQSMKHRPSANKVISGVVDVVLVRENNRSMNWRIARVVELNPIQDMEVRSAKLVMDFQEKWNRSKIL